MSVLNRTQLLSKISNHFSRQQSKKDPENNELQGMRKEDLIDDEEEDIWMDTCDSTSIFGISPQSSCKKKLEPHELLWNKQEITESLCQLPAGEAALTLLSTLSGEKLKQTIRDFEHLHLDRFQSTSLLSSPNLTNGLRKKSIPRPNDSFTEASELLQKYPNTCLLIACWLGKFEIVEVLLQKGAQVSSKDRDGRTPLHLSSSRKGQVKIIHKLLNSGAEPNEWDGTKKLTPLHCAAASADIDAIQCLISFGAEVNAGLSEKSPLHYAVLVDSCDCAEILLKSGASPNNPQVYTETPLHVSASLGSVKCTKLLLSYKADVRVQMGTMRSTPLHLAAEEGNVECVELLVQAGGPLNAVNSRGQSALHLAALSQSTDTLKTLISHQADVNIVDNDGRSALHSAVAKATLNSESAVRVLVQASKQLVNNPDKFGYTPLHIAALNENSSIVLLLLSKGADVTARTRGNITALSFIARRTPDVLPKIVSRLDQAITLHEHELGDLDCEIKLDFKPLLSGNGRWETELMLCLEEVGQRHILKHPLCESFLHLKWLKIRKFFLVSLVFHSIFIGIFTSYIAVRFLWQMPDQSDILFWPVVVFISVLACKELFQLAHGIRTYAKGWENILQWSVIVSTATVSLSQPDDESWQHHVAALAILLAWVELMMVVGRFPMFGIYVQMFTQVAINFFKFLGAYLCLIVGFSLGFSVLHNNYKSFANPLIGLLKTIIMMSGELEFEDVYFDEKSPVLYVGTSHLMLLTFVILVTIILTNLMVGLAVSDIQELRRCAGLDRMVRRTQLVAHLESLLFSKFLDYAPAKIIKPCRNGALLMRFPHYCTINIKPNDPREKKLPKDLIKSIYKLVIEKKNRKYPNLNSSIRYNFQSRSYSIGRSIKLSSDEPQKQFQDFVSQLERYLQNLVNRLDNLTNTLDIVAREFNIAVPS